VTRSRDPRASAVDRRVAKIDWDRVALQLDQRGYALPGSLLGARECAALARLFPDDARFRSTIEMEPRRFGVGRYRYFSEPLPDPVAELRASLYPPLAKIANRWQEQLGIDERFEPALAGFLARCHEAGQPRPTPLLLRYGPGGYNRLHQDVYGPVAFPLQVVVGLSRPGVDFDGGEFLLVENRARVQSRGHAIRLEQGQALVFPNRLRPVASPRGFARAEMRHGVSDVTRGERLALGVIFHDAR
jgi:hypothetical protein